MPESALPSDIRNLVARFIPSMVHLDVLLLLARDEQRAWMVGEAAGALQGEQRAYQRALDDLVGAGLAGRDDSGGVVTYRLAPASDSLRQVVTTILMMHEQRPVTLIRAVYEQASAARSFADAFRLRDKEEKGG
jgi:hypothetical protein